MIEVQHPAGSRPPPQLGHGKPPPPNGLRLLEERRLEPHQPLPLPRRRELALLSYVAEGELTERNGRGEIQLGAGTVQLLELSAGAPRPRQLNASAWPLRVLRLGLDGGCRGPSCQVARFVQRRGLMLIGSPDGSAGTLQLRHGHRLYLARLDQDETMTLPLEGRRCGYLHVLDGAVELDQHHLERGTGALVGRQVPLCLSAQRRSCLLLLELAES